CRIASLIVDPARRSEGVGSYLLQEVERLALEQGADRVRLETTLAGRAAVFYARHGFRDVARLPDWREGRAFVVMERRLLA
ncbi:MAG: GNAT family N-acetyltransferase, partial [Acidimicrobiales bacterium]